MSEKEKAEEAASRPGKVTPEEVVTPMVKVKKVTPQARPIRAEEKATQEPMRAALGALEDTPTGKHWRGRLKAWDTSMPAPRKATKEDRKANTKKAKAAAPIGVPTYVAGYGTGAAPVPEELYVRKNDAVVRMLNVHQGPAKATTLSTQVSSVDIKMHRENMTRAWSLGAFWPPMLGFI
jgi:hypothetical protein